MSDRILVWVENISGVGLIFRSAVWDYSPEDDIQANDKFDAFEHYVKREGGGHSLAKMAWCEEWDLNHEKKRLQMAYSYGEKMAPESIVIRETSCTSKSNVV